MDFIYYLLAILLVSVFISYEDFKKSVIRNKYLTLLSLILLLYFIQNFSFYAEIAKTFLINFSLTLFITFLLYFVGFWPAGDAKLFIIYSLLIPLEIFNFSQYPVMDLLINTFVPIFFIYMFLAFLRSDREKIMDSFKYAFEPYKIFLIATIFLGLAWFITLPLAMIGIPVNLFTFIVLLFLIIEIVDRIIPINLEFFYVFVAIIRLIIDYKNIYTFSFMKQLFLVILVFLFFRFFVLRLAFYLNTKKVKIEDLKEGMRIAEGISEMEREGKRVFEKIELIHYAVYDFLYHKRKKFIHEIGDEGLTKEDVNKLKRLREKGEIPFDEVLVHQQMPFAIFLLIGFLLTLYFKGDFISGLFLG
jgi:Flp pilus assembly protein protease CpaA